MGYEIREASAADDVSTWNLDSMNICPDFTDFNVQSRSGESCGAEQLGCPTSLTHQEAAHHPTQALPAAAPLTQKWVGGAQAGL